MNRHELRDRSFKLLFRKEFNSPEDMPEQVRLFCSDPEYGTLQDEDSEFVRSRYDNIISRIEEIDSIIDDNSEGWKTDRMGKVELSLLRLAVYEMLFDDDIPDSFLYSALHSGRIDPFTNQIWGQRDDNGNSKGNGDGRSCGACKDIRAG